MSNITAMEQQNNEQMTLKMKRHLVYLRHREYHKQRYLNKKAQDKRVKITCECGYRTYPSSLESHKVNNKRHRLWEQFKHIPEFVEEYRKFYAIQARDLKSYYFKKMYKKYNFEQNNGESDTSDESN